MDMKTKRRNSVWLGLAIAVWFACALARQAPSSSGQEPSLGLEYHVRLSRPSTHLVEVEVVVTRVTATSLNFVLPAWSPGRYAIYNFAKNVQEFAVVNGQGQALPWHKLDKQTWQVDARSSEGAVRVSYRVYANDLNGSFSQFDPSHANLNGASIFMYADGHKRDPLTLSIEAPAAWRVISGYAESLEQRTFQVPNYDLLVDTPIEVSPDCPVEEFREGDKLIRVAVHTYVADDNERTTLVEGLRKIVHSEMAMMPAPDFKHYTFILHFAPDISQGDGMEHLNSTQVIMGGSVSSTLARTLETAAHEFFHLWNVKRLRPASLVFYDYAREDYTPSLWFAEGVTTYYSYVHLLRAGLWSRQEFLNRLATEIRNLEMEPGRKLVSAEESSLNAWFYDRAPQMQETNFANTTVSYYNKGALLGMLLDLEIRARTRGAKSLDDVMVSMVRSFYQNEAALDEGSAASGPGPIRGYEEQDILETINRVTESDFTAFFDRNVRGADPLPYAEALAPAGLNLRVEASSDSPPTIGVQTEPHEQGLKLTVVRPGGAADRAGLSRDDLLMATDDIPIGKDTLKDRLKFFTPGAKVACTVERHGRRQKIVVTLDPPLANSYSIEELPGATPTQLSIRNGWLGK